MVSVGAAAGGVSATHQLEVKQRLGRKWQEAITHLSSGLVREHAYSGVLYVGGKYDYRLCEIKFIRPE